MDSILPSSVLEEFHAHCCRLKQATRARTEAVRFRNLVDDKNEREAIAVEDTLGKKQPSDLFEGDVNLRTLRTLLGLVDNRGWERSAHQARHAKRRHLISASDTVIRFAVAISLQVRAMRSARAVQDRVGDSAPGHNEEERMGPLRVRGHDQVRTASRLRTASRPRTAPRPRTACVSQHSSSLREDIFVGGFSVSNQSHCCISLLDLSACAQHCHLLRVPQLDHGLRNRCAATCDLSGLSDSVSRVQSSSRRPDAQAASFLSALCAALSQTLELPLLIAPPRRSSLSAYWTARTT